MASFDDFTNALNDEIRDLVKKDWSDFKTAAENDARAFLATTEADLKRWANLLATKALTLDDFKFLVAAKKETAEAVALQQAGLAKVRLDKFTTGLIATIVTVATKVFL